ncbi:MULTISPECIES: hypothetical protein [unclassified Lysobacter]|uniref:hypothetical protein n=1 Tax=unclassified Lysobacter TaxID=2635362 RepID=UPI001BE56558|nr:MULTISPECIES: hypothetical protein [unclassified Lysobacter]MBT2748697.1 hypothetical protein [Lysobacter sp. ISL-42]MBT2751632.1 hypothetical protein [Lysobacter sp. ISL-50]MBT2775826.1 hypothetical protein [Lysobacter sp. ISL-54]MBT2782209.1 hypothetical protein [Lysobacter sp. ISL-52]
MKTGIIMFGALAGALAMSTSCTKKTEPTVAASSVSKDQKTPFPGGAPITAADLTATPAALPAAPPAYNYDPYKPNITHAEYARFAWRQFIHFNSPAQKNGVDVAGKSPVVRGSIDPGRNFAASGASDFYQSGRTAGSNFGSNQLVWETFAHRSELFPAGSAPRGNLATLDPEYAFQNIKVASADARFNNLDENTQIGQNQIFFPKNGNTPSGNPQDDHIILFQARVNPVEYGYIKSIYNAQKPPTALELPPNGTDQGESVEVKSAWREMTPDLIASGRYHTAEALYYYEENGQTRARVATFGLVGLHILRKMENYPTFVYTTFEQVDSLTTPENKDTGLYVVNLYDQLQYDASVPSGTRPSAILNSGSNRTLVSLPLAGAIDSAHGYDVIPGKFTVPRGFSGPIKVQNPPVATSAVYDVNAEVQQAMASTPAFKDSVWRYYRLVGLQVLPTNEDSSVTPATPDPLTQDYYLANIVIESSQPGIQLFKGGVKDPDPDKQQFTLLAKRGLPSILGVKKLPPNADQLVMGGCMGCHGNAQYPRNEEGKGPSIFSFLINRDTMAGQGFSADERNESATKLSAKGLEYLPN